MVNQTTKGDGWSYSGTVHSAVARWDEKWEGRTWQDMPGGQADIQKMNFFLYRRGILKPISQN